MLRRPYHPPLPSPYLQPESDTPGYILGEHGGVVGFGKRGFYVAAIPAQKARETILRHHYSQSIVNNSYIHLGAFYRDNFAGVLQFGYALNPACAGKIVEGTVQGEYLELNRMWLADVCPRNSESMAISYAVKYIRRASPSVAWIQSFADERCGRLGVVYQASNFLYLGSHVSPFYFLDGDYYHNILMTAHRKSGGRGRMLRENKKRAIPLAYRQFRYVLFLKQSWRKRLRLKIQPYPKPKA
ncbi:hypothetical protein LJE06_09280 [Bilophila wadsworthia]|jgi:hypothetical protein|uniref:Mom family adenine methylcarbamoylation protein n=1 Tax=Bilophila wadsworthia TaxID=35833 RepID=UPI001D0A9FE3|nr:hypothetical protein [Bilophila wadsworthia]MCB8571303.1 hypothetical protein [Bilophila wadsworthia]MCC2714651.1 hypothetical protein [Bilophila wadsworthia]